MSCYHSNITWHKTNSIIKKYGNLGTDIHIIYSAAQDFKEYKYYLKLHKEIQEQEQEREQK